MYGGFVVVITLTLPPATGRTTEKRIGIVTGVSPGFSRNFVIVPLAGAWTPLFQNSLSSRHVPRIGTGSAVRSLPHLTGALVAADGAGAAGAVEAYAAARQAATRVRRRGVGTIGRDYRALDSARTGGQPRPRGDRGRLRDHLGGASTGRAQPRAAAGVPAPPDHPDRAALP